MKKNEKKRKKRAGWLAKSTKEIKNKETKNQKKKKAKYAKGLKKNFQKPSYPKSVKTWLPLLSLQRWLGKGMRKILKRVFFKKSF